MPKAPCNDLADISSYPAQRWPEVTLCVLCIASPAAPLPLADASKIYETGLEWWPVLEPELLIPGYAHHEAEVWRGACELEVGARVRSAWGHVPMFDRLDVDNVQYILLNILNVSSSVYTVFIYMVPCRVSTVPPPPMVWGGRGGRGKSGK